MGSFSWTKADIDNTQVANIQGGKTFKFLIPAEFGGGFIRDRYRDYGDLGNLGDEEESWDMYELLAIWNADMPYMNGKVRDYLEGNISPMKKQDNNTFDNRKIGIEIGCYEDEVDKLKYPLKLVSPSYKGSYEECEGRSYGDPNQGWSPLSWEEYHTIQQRTREYYKEHGHY